VCYLSSLYPLLLLYSCLFMLISLLLSVTLFLSFYAYLPPVCFSYLLSFLHISYTYHTHIIHIYSQALPDVTRSRSLPCAENPRAGWKESLGGVADKRIGEGCVVCGVWCMLCGVWCVVCAVCCVLYAVCCMLCAVCCVLYAVML
jgi:hypothetical protein